MGFRRSHSLNGRVYGIFLVLLGSTLWGVSGTVAQFLFEEKGFRADWLVVVRLLVSGACLLLFIGLIKKQSIFKVWGNKHHRNGLLLFGLLGMLSVQYTYFAAIEAGNAATATLLQYLGPVFVTVYIAIKAKKAPTPTQLLSVLLALLGTLFLVTAGNFHVLAISGMAIFWGIASALALAFYTIQPVQLLKEWGSGLTVGWGMLIGGVAFSFFFPPWQYEGEMTLVSFVAILFVIFLGTLLAFSCYLESLNYLKANETSLLSCAEPLSAAILAVLWLNVPFGLSEWGGAVCIMTTIVLLSLGKASQATNM